MLPKTFLDDVIERTDIVALVGERVELKKAGKDFQGLCPFHSEKHPSFTVSATKQFYHCFGCGAHGNAISFMVEYDGFGFIDAVESLAQRVGLRMPERVAITKDEQIKVDRDDIILSALKVAKQTFMANLNSYPDAVQYMKNRGLVRDTVVSFGIGYADDQMMSRLSEFSTDILIDAGLLVVNEESGEIYDKFRHRIMFPICSENGNIIGFGGRVIKDQVKPKYLNSPETSVFIKGHELFGLNVAKKAIRQSRIAVVLEGYMDVSMLHQHGETRAVAALGTSVTEYQIKRLFRMCDDIIFCFDGDTAGQNAAARASSIVLTSMTDGKTARFLHLPESHDPDSFVQEFGLDAWNKLIVVAMPLSKKVTEVLLDDMDVSLPENKAILSKKAESLCASIVEAPRFREALVSNLESVIGMRIRTKKISSITSVSDLASRPGLAPVNIHAEITHYELYRRIAMVCAMDDGADTVVAGVDIFSDLIVSWFACVNKDYLNLHERAQTINDGTLRAFIIDSLVKRDALWGLLDAAARSEEQDVARRALTAEINRLQRAREAAEFLN